MKKIERDEWAVRLHRAQERARVAERRERETRANFEHEHEARVGMQHHAERLRAEVTEVSAEVTDLQKLLSEEQVFRQTVQASLGEISAARDEERAKFQRSIRETAIIADAAGGVLSWLPDEHRANCIAQMIIDMATGKEAL